MEFYIYLNGATRGPLSEERVQSLLAEGVLHASDLASGGEEAEWKALASFRRFSSALDAIPEVFPPHAPLPAPAVLPPVPVLPPSHPLPLASLGPYSRAALAPNETPYYKTSLHWIVFVRFAVLALLVFLFVALPFAIGVQALTGSELGWLALPLPALILLPPIFAFASSELVITDRRVLIKSSIVRRQTVEMFIAKVESIGVDQSFLGRLFDYGAVVLRGAGGFEETFESIASPLQFRNWVQRLQSSDATFATPVQ